MVSDGGERTKSQRNEDILSVAERVFARDGFAAATMDAIAREAGVSKGGLYRHFSGKDELFLTVAARAATTLELVLRSTVQECTVDGAFGAVKACIARMMSFGQEDEGRVKLALDCSAIGALVDPRSQALPAFDAAAGNLVDVALDLLRRGQSDGSVRSDIDVVCLAISLWGAVIGALQMTSSAGVPSSRSTLRVGEDMVDVIASSVRSRRR